MLKLKNHLEMVFVDKVLEYRFSSENYIPILKKLQNRIALASVYRFMF